MRSRSWFFLIFFFLGLALPGRAAAAPEVKYISPDALKAVMRAPDQLIIDVSKGWWTYDQKITGSLVYPGETDTWAPQLPKDEQIILYCG